MSYTVSVFKKITLLIMTMALAVVMIACEAAAGKPGEAGEAGPPGEPAPKLPYLTKGFSPVELAATGEMATKSISLAGHFTDPHEGQLTYSASPEPSGVVTTAVSDSTLTLTAVGEGKATVTVAAKNKDGVSAFNPGAQFTVTVMETVAPTVEEGGIPDQILYKDDGEQMLTLTKADADSMGYFSHAGDITYIVDDLPKGFIEATEADGVLTLKPLVTGETIVTVVATADNKSTDPVKFTVTVEKGTEPEPEPEPEPMAPVKVDEIDDVTLDLGETFEIEDVSIYFDDPDEQTLEYSIEVTEGSLNVFAVLDDNTLTLRGDAYGDAKVTVTATDEDDLTAEQMINVTVADQPEPMAPVTKGTISDQTLNVEATYMLNAGDYFIDSDSDTLDYKVSSSNEMIASVTEDDGTVTVTAVAVGMATITVTAKDEGDRSVDQMFEVTVKPKPEPKPKYPSTIDGKGEKETVPVESGQMVTSDNYLIVRPNKKSATEWELIGEMRGGPVTIRVVDGGKEVHSFSVTVANSAPKANTPAAIYYLNKGASEDFYRVSTASATLTELDLDSLFTFVDSGSPGHTRKFEITSSPQIKAKLVKDTEDKLHVDVVREDGDNFTINVVAVDDKDEKSEPVTLTMHTKPALSKKYWIFQNASGDIAGVTVENRQSKSTKTADLVRHVLQLSDDKNAKPIVVTSAGFKFAKRYFDGLDATDKPDSFTPGLGLPDTDPNTTTPTTFTHYYTVDAVGSIDNESFSGVGDNNPEVLEVIATAAAPAVSFTLHGTTGSTITITYHVWANHDKDTGENATPFTEKKTVKTVRVTVK